MINLADHKFNINSNLIRSNHMNIRIEFKYPLNPTQPDPLGALAIIRKLPRKSVKPSKIGNAVKKKKESTEITLTYTSSQY
uniref:Uncharacterized protein n=1 Tax=Rhizophagus irregularis (strain DAOM 181602 / DAOM 197198 / MUCL 43194) TaxID=747089 RepID=U9THJ4_RHIID